MSNSRPDDQESSTAEREGIVDQQDAALEATERATGGEASDDAADEHNEAVNPSRPPAEGGREEVDEDLDRQDRD